MLWCTKNISRNGKMVENEILLADQLTRKWKNGKNGWVMGHSHSNSVLLESKEKGNLEVWNAINIEIACNVPGHYQIGMIAKVDVK